MKKIQIEIAETKELTEDKIYNINMLKNQHWRHTEEEHMKWFKENIQNSDEHLMIWGGDHLLAYLNLVHVDVEIDKQPYRMFGIGNVCVRKDREHSGIGALLMMAANAFLKETKICGLLLCHENTLRFYEYCGWKILDANRSVVAGDSYEHYVMLYDPSRTIGVKVNQFVADRSF